MNLHPFRTSRRKPSSVPFWFLNKIFKQILMTSFKKGTPAPLRSFAIFLEDLYSFEIIIELHFFAANNNSYDTVYRYVLL